MIQEFEIFGTTVSSYNAMFYVGCIFFIGVLCLHRKVYGFSLWKALLMAVISVPIGYACTSLLFAFEVGISEMNFSGFSWYGAVYFMPLVFLVLHPLMNDVLKMSGLDYIHNLAAPLALMNGFMKLGCFLYGCCYGVECSWGVYNSFAGTDVFPIQIVETIWNFAVCIFILCYERKPENKYKVYPVYMIVYSIGRIFLEIGRSGAEVSFKPLFGVITGGMLYALAAISIGVIWLHLYKKSYDKKHGKKPIVKAGKDGWRH